MNEIVQIRLCGLGGQGIVLMGVILTDAAVRDGMWAAGSNSYGAQARGSACQSEAIISREPVDFPLVLEADLLVAMSQEAYKRFLPEVKSSGLVVYDHPQVRPSGVRSQRHVPIPATRKAVEELGNKQVSNIIMLAASIWLTGVVSREALQHAAQDNVPTRFRGINLKALETGFTLGGKARKA